MTKQVIAQFCPQQTPHFRGKICNQAPGGNYVSVLFIRGSFRYIIFCAGVRE